MIKRSQVIAYPPFPILGVYIYIAYTHIKQWRLFNSKSPLCEKEESFVVKRSLLWAKGVTLWEKCVPFVGKGVFLGEGSLSYVGEILKKKYDALKICPLF